MAPSFGYRPGFNRPNHRVWYEWISPGACSRKNIGRGEPQIMSSASTAARIENARQKMAEAKLPALLVSQMDNVRWMTGFSGSNGFVVLTADTAMFATD